MAEAYRKEGVDINPLLLIQLPNDGETMTGDDNSVKEEVLTYLDSIKGINVANGKLAIWLSNEKTDNLQTITNPDDIAEVLLFKQAIALGWDCPRAAVLLIFRKIESFTFSAQTVGRILRMPEPAVLQNDMFEQRLCLYQPEQGYYRNCKGRYGLYVVASRRAPDESE